MIFYDLPMLAKRYSRGSIRQGVIDYTMMQDGKTVGKWSTSGYPAAFRIRSVNWWIRFRRSVRLAPGCLGGPNPVNAQQEAAKVLVI